MTTTTDQFQKLPDFYNSKEACLAENRRPVTNSRYSNYTQRHFTAGDEDQFEKYRDAKSYRICMEKIDLGGNLFRETEIFLGWVKYRNLEATVVIDTFRYIFHKFKKGIFVKIADNQLVVFLPFAKRAFYNEWSGQIKLPPGIESPWNFISQEFHKYRSSRGYPRREFPIKEYNIDMNKWYGNNCLIRYDKSEGDTNNNIIRDMLKTLCKERTVPDIEFFINRRDFPILKRNNTEAYNHIWDGKKVPLVSHEYAQYSPILSMATAPEFADIATPTYEDWARIRSFENIFFPRSCKDYRWEFNHEWNTKIPQAVFRGTSTGCGVTPETNMRLKVAKMSAEGVGPPTTGLWELPYLDAGITQWNTRYRKLEGNPHLQTQDVDSFGFGLVPELNPQQQSNYKYIININGHVSAFRLSLEMNMGSVILMVDSEYEIWFKKFLKPWNIKSSGDVGDENYIPIDWDLGNLLETIQWCRDNDEKCAKIAENSVEFYRKFLGRDGILDYMQKTLVDLKHEMGVYLYNTQSPLDVQMRGELVVMSDRYYPDTKAELVNINRIPWNSGRCFGLLRGLQWLVNFVLGNSADFGIIAQEESVVVDNNNKIITKYSLAGAYFIVKATSEGEKIKENIHEAFIGTRVINELSAVVPNFVYIYGAYKNPKEQVCVIQEYIHGITLGDYITRQDSLGRDRD